MTTITLNTKELKRYSLFKKQDEMDRDIWRYVEWLNEHNVRQSVIDVLLHLGSRALMTLGIAFPKQTTIAKCLKLSDKTVNLAIKDLEALEIIDSKRTLNGWRASGKVYRIKPFCIERLSQKVKSVKCVKPYSANDLTLVSEFEPYSSESPTLKKDVAAKADSSNAPAKTKTFYQRLKELAQARKGTIANFSKLMSIIFGRIKKLKKEAVQLTHQQLESVMYQAFKALLSKENVHNDEAMLNTIITNKLNDILKPAQQGAASTHSRGQAKSYIEREPDWLEENRRQWAAKEAARQLEQAKRVDDEEDLEAYKQRVLTKLGLS